MSSQMKVVIVCPLCEKKGEILIPDKVLQDHKGTSSVLVRAGITCHHSYQVFIDKSGKVRGYQRTDFEVSVAQPQGVETTVQIVKPAITWGPDTQITTVIQDFMSKIDEFLSAGTCAKAIADLYDFIQSRRGFHPVLPDMKNWANQLRVGATWDQKTKDWIRKRAMTWLEKVS